MLEFALSYVETSKRDLSALGDLVQEALVIIEADGRSLIKYRDLVAAKDVLVPSDTFFAITQKRIEGKIKRQRNTKRGSLPAPELPEPCAEDAEGVAPALEPNGKRVNLFAEENK